MSRSRLIAALSIAIVLIGGAVWFRLTNTRATKAQLVAVTAKEQAFAENTFLEGILEPSKGSPNPSAEPLSPTEAVSRQLFSDYVDLASRGQNTADNLKSLADKYAESIAGQTISAKKMGMESVIAVADTEENMARYAQALANIRDKYKNLAESEYGRSNLSDINSPDFKKFMNAMGQLYKASADELLSLAVPFSLAENHLALINNHLSSATAMETLSRINDDPLIAYTAMTTQSKNSKEEANLIVEIQTALIANGVIFESGL